MIVPWCVFGPLRNPVAATRHFETSPLQFKIKPQEGIFPVRLFKSAYCSPRRDATCVEGSSSADAEFWMENKRRIERKNKTGPTNLWMLRQEASGRRATFKSLCPDSELTGASRKLSQEIQNAPSTFMFAFVSRLLNVVFALRFFSSSASPSSLSTFPSACLPACLRFSCHTEVNSLQKRRKLNKFKSGLSGRTRNGERQFKVHWHSLVRSFRFAVLPRSSRRVASRHVARPLFALT